MYFHSNYFLFKLLTIHNIVCLEKEKKDLDVEKKNLIVSTFLIITYILKNGGS